MKIVKIVAATALLLTVSTLSYAQMGAGMKCGGGMGNGGMMMKGDFKTQKSMMLDHISKMKGCVEASQSKEELKACKMQMMQNKKNMMQKNKSGKCGVGKCGGGKSFLKFNSLKGSVQNSVSIR